MNSTSDPNIFETDWFNSESQPLLFKKIIYSKAGDLLTYVVCKKGKSSSYIDTSESGEPKTIILTTEEEFEDDSQNQFNKLKSFVNKKY